MDVREQLIDILLQKPNKCTFEQLADFLIAGILHLECLLWQRKYADWLTKNKKL